MRPDVDSRPFTLNPRHHHHHTDNDDKKNGSTTYPIHGNIHQTDDRLETSSSSTSATNSTGSLRKRSLPKSNSLALEETGFRRVPAHQSDEDQQHGGDDDDHTKSTGKHAPFTFSTIAPFPPPRGNRYDLTKDAPYAPLSPTSRSNNTQSSMFSSRPKYTALPNPNGTPGSSSSSSGGKRRGSTISPLKKMIIAAGLITLLLVGLMGGKHVTRSTVGEQDALEGFNEDGWTEGDLKEFESPPFLPEGGFEGDEVDPQEDGDGEGEGEGEEEEEKEEMFHILPVPHGNGHKNAAATEDKWSAEDIAELDGQEMDEPAGGKTHKGDADVEDVQVDKAAEQEHDSEAGLTAPEEMTPSRGPDSFESDKDATATEFCDEAHDETLKLVQYAIVIDAGSTGSRIHVYKFNNCGPTPALEYETFKAIQPGLSSFARDPTAAAASLDPLMQEALRVVPESLQKCTPVEVKATAGLRLLPGREGEAILEEVRVRLESDYPFAVSKEEHAIEIMDGKDEGVYAWITANYLLGKIGAGSPDAETMAVMDLGGASTQIVFEPTFPDKETTLAEGDHKYDLSFGGKDYTLYQHSYLGYGLMRARRSVHNLVAFTWSFLQPGGAAGVEWDDLAEEVQVPNPCLGKGMTRRVELDPAGRKNVNVTMVGAESSFESCKRVVELVLAKDAVCEVKPCSFNGVYQPSILDTFPNGQLLALSYFTDRIQPLLAPYAAMPKHYKADDSDAEEIISAEVDVSDTKTLSIKMLALMAKDVCAGPAVWKRRWGHDKEAMAELEGRPEYCLDLTFMHGLLGLGYELSEKRELVVEKKLRGVELGWALGAGIALVEKATLTCTA